MSDDLVAFWTARLDEDAVAAMAAVQSGNQFAEPGDHDPRWRRMEGHGGGEVRDMCSHHRGCIVVFDEGAPGPEEAAHIARYDPARVLREVEAKRAILGMHSPTRPHPEFGFTYPAAARFCGYCGPGDNWQAEQEPDHYPFALWPCRHARLVVAVWDDHPDYRPEWKP
jgi:hypothetical protein